MPPKKQKNYKKKKPRSKMSKKQAYRNSYAISKITAPLMPKTRLCMMKYIQRFQLDPAQINADNGATGHTGDTTCSTLPYRTFTINNLKDFDEMTSGVGGPSVMNDQFANHQPRSYDEWGTHYNNMTVLSAKTTIEARNRYAIQVDTNGHSYSKPPEPVAVGYLTSHFNKTNHAGVAGVKFNDLLEQNQITYRELNDDRQKVKLTHMWQLKKEPTHRKNLNMETTTSDYAWGAMYDQDINSANKRYLHITASPLGITDNLDPKPIDFVVQISVVVLLSNRNEIGRS